MDGARKTQGFFAGGCGHEDDEFVAAVAEAKIGAAAELADAPADAAKQLAADEMAMKIVDELEAVQIEEDEAQGLHVAMGLFQFAFEDFVEMARVEEAGDVVGDGELLDAGNILGVLDGDCGVVDEDMQERDGVVGLVVETGIEYLQNSVGAFAAADGHSYGG